MAKNVKPAQKMAARLVQHSPVFHEEKAQEECGRTFKSHVEGANLQIHDCLQYLKCLDALLELVDRYNQHIQASTTHELCVF